MTTDLRPPTKEEAARFWLRLGWTAFGGPAAQIALMHTELVRLRGWVEELRFRRDLALCQALPGPEAQQLAALTAMRLHGWRMGVFAGAAFVVPGLLLMLLAGSAVAVGSVPAGAIAGLRAGALALLMPAAVRLAGRVSGLWGYTLMVAGAAAGLAGCPQPVIAAAAAAFGAWRMGGTPGEAPMETPVERPPGAKVFAVWAAPWVVAGAVFGVSHAVFWAGLHALRLAAAGFGGAYALLPEAFRLYAADAAAAADATALAEAVPGPLMLAVPHVAMLSGRAAPGGFSPEVAGVSAALLSAWALFATSTLVVVFAAFYADRLAVNPRVRAALAGIGAAAAGQIAALVWPVGLAALMRSGGIDPIAAGLSAAAAWVVWQFPRFAWAIVPLCGLIGWAALQ